MNKPWLSLYGSTIPETINENCYKNIIDLISESSEKFSDKVAFSNFGVGLTYTEVERLSRNFTSYLQQIGIKKGDRVAIMSPNHLTFPVAMFGILRTGAVQVNVNPMYTHRELKHQLNDAEAETIVIFSGSTGVLAEIIEETGIKRVIVIGLDDLINKGLPSPPVDERLTDTVSFITALNVGAEKEYEPVDINAEDLIYLQYTGGTTGVSKGAMLSHRNMIANIAQLEAFAAESISYGEEVIMTALPLYHIFALMVNALSYYKFGATNVLITNPRDMPAFVEEWSKWPVTFFTGVNTLYNGLLHTPGFDKLDFSSIKWCAGGGAAVQQVVSDRWLKVTGKPITEGYGLSETSPVLTLNPISDSEFTGAIGIPFPSTEISIRDDNGNEVGIGVAGELCARGPQVMQGYWRREEATNEVMTEDGYFCTGDIAEMDEEGFFRIVDRKKDMILVSGFNVFPNEIEAIVAEISGVVECACVGVPDDRTGEVVKVYIVRNDDALDSEQVEAYCRDNLAAYKVPKQVEFIDELPKSAVGKILRKELRDR